MARGKPERDPRRREYDERVYHRGFAGPSNLAIGLIALVVLAVGVYVAFAKMVKTFPFAPEGQVVRAVFENAATLRPTSPVRIAGVNVGEVTSIDSLGDQAEVEFTVSEQGQPVHEDATVEIRPRLFLEGNFFLDLEPGSPSAPELGDDESLPVTQTAVAVQLDQVLEVLDRPARADLSDLLEGYGTALTYEPKPADDADQDPDVQGETAAEAINDSFVYGGDAGRDTAIANTALLGTEPHDLSRLIRSQARVSGALADREGQLQDLITNFDVTAGAFAAESANLAESIELLAPTLEEARPALARLDASLPPLRRLAIESTPAVQELPATIAASQPWLDQTAGLLASDELGLIAALTERSAPNLALATAAGSGLMPEIEDLSRCASEILVPTGDVVLEDEFPTGQPNFRELLYAAVGQAGIGQDFDGNGQYLRANPAGGPVQTRSAVPGATAPNEYVYSNAIVPPEGTRPVLTPPPPIRGDVACHRNTLPDLNGVAAAAGPPSPAEVSP
jgi:ABC-type transporter Mla subunit MlaD